MKQLFLIAMLVLASVAAKAQFIYNQAQCPLEYRRFCIDQNCIPNYPGGSWAPLLPGPSSTPITSSFCNPGEIDGFEVRYDFTQPPFCTGSISVINPSALTLCGMWNIQRVGACECTADKDGIYVEYNGLNVHISD